MRALPAVISFAFLLTINLAAAPHRGANDVPLRNWPVAFDRDVHATPSASGKFQAATNALASNPAAFIAVQPCRLVDTRTAAGAYGGPSFAASTARSFIIPGGGNPTPCNVPVASAYSLNFTIVGYSGRGNLRAFPTGSTLPMISTTNFGSGLPIANAAIVPADPNGSIDVFVSGATDVVIDINGYFAAGVVTKLTAGTGLTVTGTNTVTVGITPGAVTATELGPNAVTAAAINAGAVGLAAIDATQVQRRVDGTCSSPYSLIAINANGTVTCGISGQSQALSVSTSLLVPSGVTQLIVEAWGGGGGGGGYYGPPNGSGGGGGGAYARAILAVMPGQSLNILVGAGGLGGPHQAGGQDGTSTSIAVGMNTLLTAGGGAGAISVSGGPGGTITSPAGTVFLEQVPGSAGVQGTNVGGLGGAAGPTGGTRGRGGDGSSYPGTSGLTGQPGEMIITFVP